MEGAVVQLVVTAIGAGIFLVWWAFNKPRAPKAWAITAQRWGLAQRGLELRGTIDGVFSVHVVAQNQATTLVTVSAHGALPVNLSFAHADSPEAVGIAGYEIEVGQPEFDKRVRLSGEPFTAFALLNHSARQFIMRAVTAGVHMKHGVIHLRKNGVPTEANLLVDYLHLAVGLARSMRCDQMPAEQSLAAVASTDPWPGPRFRALSQLIAHYPQSPTTRQVAHQALRDGDASVCLYAASWLDDRAMLQRLAHEAPEEHVRLRALVRLGGQGLEPLLLNGLNHADPKVQDAAVAGLREHGSLACVVPLQTMAKRALPGLQQSANQAILVIQNRHPHAGQGQISIVETGQGEGLLSLGAEGQLSEVEDGA